MQGVRIVLPVHKCNDQSVLMLSKVNACLVQVGKGVVNLICEQTWACFSMCSYFPPDVQISPHINQLCNSSVLESLNSQKHACKCVSQTPAQCPEINFCEAKTMERLHWTPTVCLLLPFRFRPCVAPHSPAQLLPLEGASTQGHGKLVFNDPAATRAPGQLLRVSTSRQYDTPSHAP